MDAADKVERLLAALKLAMTALPDSWTAGPGGKGYAWAWDELTGDEQEWVKSVRGRVLGLVVEVLPPGWEEPPPKSPPKA